MFFPDFVVSLAPSGTALAETTPVLIEVKGEGWLSEQKVSDYFECEHPDYGPASFVVEISGCWYIVRREATSGLLMPGYGFSWMAVRRYAEHARKSPPVADAGTAGPTAP